MCKIMIAILLKLIHGPAVRGDIFKELQPLNKRTFDRKVRTLIKKGLIFNRLFINFDRNSYKGTYISVLVLKPSGADYISHECHTLDWELIRTGGSSFQNIVHDLYLAKIFRRIADEASSGLFRITRIEDESTMKRRYKEQNKSLKGIYLSDACIEVTKQKDFGIFLELDNGCKGASYWNQKIGSWCSADDSQSILVITPKAERLDKLTDFITDAGLTGRLQLTTLEEFMTFGLNNYLNDLIKNPGLWLYNYIKREVVRFR